MYVCLFSPGGLWWNFSGVLSPRVSSTKTSQILSSGQGRDKGMATAMSQVGRGGQRQAGPCEHPIPQLGWKERGQELVDLGMCVWDIHTEREHPVPPFLPPSTFPAGRVALLCGERDSTAGKGSLGAFKICFQRGSGQAVEVGVPTFSGYRIRPLSSVSGPTTASSSPCLFTLCLRAC